MVRRPDQPTSTTSSPPAAGGETTAANGQNLCEACNYTKEAPGWRADLVRTAGHLVEITTPTGLLYRSSLDDVA